MQQVRVTLKDRSYSITIGKGVSRFLLREIKRHFPSNRFVLLTNTTVLRLYRSHLRSLLGKNLEKSILVIPDGEKYKTLSQVEKIYHQMAKLRVDRKTGLVAFGGGVVGDIGGFVAATYLRGIPFIQVPTTLLSQVDSSVGGKTGVDLPFGKNLVGAFYQPKSVLIDTDFCKTLPRREFVCGLAEVIKYGIIRDSTFFNFLEKNLPKILALNPQVLEKMIGRSCAIKAEIVSRDETETTGLRSLLNFGHTVGHAIETLSGYNQIHHGEAVALGMIYAATLSHKRGLCSLHVFERILGLLEQTGLPTNWPSYSHSAYKKVIALDKKVSGNKIRYIALKKIGQAKPVDLTVDEVTRYL